VYVGFRFDLAFAPGAILALAHDVTVVVGIFTITGHEFNLPMIGALLTIIGYSLNDTIVIYDRIRENMARYRRQDTAAMINASINETLGRTVATSVTSSRPSRWRSCSASSWGPTRPSGLRVQPSC
jgi:preprotein translocase subunit SecF